MCEERLYWTDEHLARNDRFIKFTSFEHTHLPLTEWEEIREMMSTINERVKGDVTAIGQIYEEEIVCTNLSTSALATVHIPQIARKNKRVCYILFENSSSIQSASN